MLLNLLDDAAPQYLSIKPIVDIAGCILYFVSYERNAWHRTRIFRYTPGCMHTEVRSAKMWCENHRKQGKVFSIEQIPAILVMGGGWSVAVTQINTTEPLVDYLISPQAINPRDAEESARRTNRRRILVGAPFGAALRSFCASSNHWRRRPKMKDSLLMFSAHETENLRQTALKQWKATILSAGQEISWSEDDTTCADSKPVRRIVRNIKRSEALREKRMAVLGSVK